MHSDESTQIEALFAELSHTVDSFYAWYVVGAIEKWLPRHGTKNIKTHH